MLTVCILTIQKSTKKNLLKKKISVSNPWRLCYQNIIRNSAKSSFIRAL